MFISVFVVTSLLYSLRFKGLPLCIIASHALVFVVELGVLREPLHRTQMYIEVNRTETNTMFIVVESHSEDLNPAGSIL
jgi:hypothetical protein